MSIKKGDIATIDKEVSWWPDDDEERTCIVLDRVKHIVTALENLENRGEVMIGKHEHVRYVLWEDGTVGMCSENLLREI